ncbi:MAG: type II secretion system F family protein [archaeon]
MKLKKIHWIGLVFGILMIATSAFLFLGKNNNLMYFMSGLAVTIIVIPFVMDTILANKNEQEIDEKFLEFSRNLVESVNTGTPISKSIVNSKRNNYGVLNPFIEKLANQISLGIPVNTALMTFAEDVGSPVIGRAVALMREAERAGGQIEYILESVAKSMAEVEKLKKERKAAISTLVVQGYIIFFIFIGIMLVMQYKILPLTAGIGSFGNMGSLSVSSITQASSAPAKAVDIQEFSKPLLYLLVTQGLFAGLTIGKLAEGSLKNGIKHSFILAIAALLIYTGAGVFFG